ncbi:MAG: methylated-DNA--[protein]-cysteine S-methyltransferase [Calditrichia bacterium]
MNYQQLAEDYRRIEKAIQYLEANFNRQPQLSEIAAAINLSEYHFQKLFSRWVGISPKRFLQFLTKEYAKKLLEKSRNLLEVTYDSGLSSPSRLHDLFVTCEAVTPGEFARKGEGLTIYYGFHPTPFGECLAALTGRGLCALHFVMENDRQGALEKLKLSWEHASLREDPERTAAVVRQIFLVPLKPPKPLHLLLKGTNFQIKVWEALLKIPVGAVVSYEDIAAFVGMPRAARAVGNAVGQNPLPFIIPCHRVIKKVGDFGNYGGGTARKKAMIGWEAARIYGDAGNE